MITPDKTTLRQIWNKFSANVIRNRLTPSSMRVILLRSIGAFVGKRVTIARGVTFNNSNIIVGDNVAIGPNCVFEGIAEISIAAGVRIEQGRLFGARDDLTCDILIHYPTVVLG